MKMLSVLALTLLVSTSAFAQRHTTTTTTVHTPSDYSTGLHESSVTGYLGFGRSSLNIGGDFEAAMTSDTGVGGYFLLATENNSPDVQRPQVIAIGGDVKLHFRPGSFDFYVAPGFGIDLVDIPGDKQYTTLGPSIRFGVLYNLTPRVGLGIEQQTVYNWFSKNVAESFSMANAALRFMF